jgi:hypothetical protein
MTAEDVILDVFGRDDHSQPLKPVQRAAEKELSYDVAFYIRGLDFGNTRQ